MTEKKRDQLLVRCLFDLNANNKEAGDRHDEAVAEAYRDFNTGNVDDPNRWRKLRNAVVFAFDARSRAIRSAMIRFDREWDAVDAAETEDDSLPVKSYDVWCEGWKGSGDGSTAYKVGTAEASSFAKACDILCCDDKDYNPVNLTSWGCSLYGNETDARKAFG